MKKVMALLLLSLGMVLPVFAGENYTISQVEEEILTWCPSDHAGVIDTVIEKYLSLSEDQQNLIDCHYDGIFESVYDEIDENNSFESPKVSKMMLRLSQNYEEMKNEDKEAGEVFGAMMAMQEFSSEEMGNALFPNVVMKVAFMLEGEERTTLENFAQAIEQNFDSFR